MITSSSHTDALQQTADFLHRHEQKDLLRFITCGSVDDGKSTLIGRLLLESGNVYDDHIAALRADTTKHGTTNQEIDPALLVDGLEDERKQGITIDVAYRYFQTANRKFIIADSPGHQQYTRNMATAASTAELAVILIDARKGVLDQTRRHSFIASLLGVGRLLVAVNKMDLVDYSATRFEEICGAFGEFARQLDVHDLRYVPVSGLCGDNVTKLSDNTPWYEGPALLEVLETVPVGDRKQADALRFPVQRVSRPDANFRGYSGTVVSGQVRPGDEVLVLPGGQRSRVGSIVTFEGKLSHARCGRAITLTLEDELDVTRGDVIVHAGSDQPPQISKVFDAAVVWMSETALVPGKPYWLKHAHQQTKAEVTQISHRIDVNTLNCVEARALKLNEIGHCRFAVHAPIVFDAYRLNRQTGSFILVDRITHETVAAGMITEPDAGSQPNSHWNVSLQSSQLQYAPSRISAARRQERHGHGVSTILLTGLSGSGKTTLALRLEERLFDAGYAVTVIDGQNLRHGISRDLGFSAEERSENLRRAAEICRLINDAGMICIAAFVAPDADTRAKVRQVIGSDRLHHIHLSAPAEVCRDRDVSGRYQAAERGEIVNFPGVTADYSFPSDADLVIPTGEWSVEQSIETLERWVRRRIGAGQ